MTTKRFARRQALIAEGRCPRCARKVHPWPMKRPDICSDEGWSVCIRHWPDIIEKENRIVVTD